MAKGGLSKKIMTIWYSKMNIINIISLHIIIFAFFAPFHVLANNQKEKIIFPPDSLQMVVVITPNLNASGGTIQFFEREHAYASWVTVNPLKKIVVGKNGLGWSQDIYTLGYKGSMKREGDKKAPAGLFYLSSVFGYALKNKMKHLKMPYFHADESLICVDDKNSMFYNQIVDSSAEKKDWKSYEKMKRNDELYRLGVIVDYNTFPTIAGRGSCIFLHIWRNSNKPTVGCTAMAFNLMKKLVSWLEIEKKPVLVQLPQSEFELVSKDWRLPEK